MLLISLFTVCNKTEKFKADEDLQLKSTQPYEVTMQFEVNLLDEIN